MTRATGTRAFASTKEKVLRLIIVMAVEENATVALLGD